MSSTTRQMALLPHELNKIDQVFQDILQERGLPRNCEAAEVIARRLLGYYQRGIRESGALKYMTASDKRPEALGAFLLGNNPEVSTHRVAADPTIHISPDELDMLQRTFDRVCLWCSIPRYGKRAERLARHLTNQFRDGVNDEAALFDSAMWLEQNSDRDRYRSDA
ncbi:hypothetical protein PWG15_33760 (plasmid) [Ensifer adhaerens]|uniref:hypothetical protein n=1 Tax=Ensifer adhaerens TaxID=106592 RepID=UPI0023A94C9D|nr:hypothetical protein [Ensifer adhaerens]WDZ81870.1 hypothetical protein PWG15_33760 [Ensifer adhaerens]